MSPIRFEDLAPEEQDLVSQLGKISRPFAHNPASAGAVQRLTDLYHALTTTAVTWEVVGVDVSVWQGDIDFSVLSTLAQFVLIRYGIGNTSVDSKAAQNVARASAAKMPYAGYWYDKPAHNWDLQAQSFAGAITRFGGQLYHTSDFEENGGLGKQALDSWLQKYFNKLLTLLVNDGIWSDAGDHQWYTSKNICDNMLPNPNGWMRESHLDVAHWTTAPEPLLPNEWVKAGKSYKFWQHAVINADGYGVESAKIDVQRYHGTRSQFEDEFNITLPVPPPPPEPDTWTVVRCAWVNGRSAPDSTVDNRVVSVRAGQPVTNLHKQSGDWCLCGLGPIICWIHKYYLEATS